MPQIPADPNQVKSIVDRLQKIRKNYAPKGLPANQVNHDKTDADFPLAREQPLDKGWDVTKMITGSGGGPEMHQIDLA